MMFLPYVLYNIVQHCIRTDKMSVFIILNDEICFNLILFITYLLVLENELDILVILRVLIRIFYRFIAKALST
jgi:hypothetical protein